MRTLGNWILQSRSTFRPQPNSEGEAVGEEAIGGDSIDGAGVMKKPEAQVIRPAEGIEKPPALDESLTHVPVGKPEPAQPTRAEKASHDITHIEYRSWCPHCLMGRRPAAQHRFKPATNACGTLLFCADYAFDREAQDEETATYSISRLCPSRALFATVCGAKGHDEPAIRSYEAVPGYSATAASASNGRAKRAVQTI